MKTADPDLWRAVYDKVQAKMRKPPDGVPETFIQWKGTNVCMDVNCPCGMSSHWDTEFLYTLRCPGCRKIYAVGTHVQLVEITEQDAADQGGHVEESGDYDQKTAPRA